MLFLKNSPAAQILDLEITFQLLFLMLLTLVTPVSLPILLGSILLSILFNFHQSSLQLTVNYSGCPRIVYYLLPNSPAASQPETVTPWPQGGFHFPPPPVDPRMDNFPGHHAWDQAPPTWEEAPPTYEATVNPEEQAPAPSHSRQQQERETEETAPTVVESLLVEEDLSSPEQNGSSQVANLEQDLSSQADSLEGSHNIPDSTQETVEVIFLEEDAAETLPQLPQLIEDAGEETGTTAATSADRGRQSPGRGRGGRRGRRPPGRAPQRGPSRRSTRS